MFNILNLFKNDVFIIKPKLYVRYIFIKLIVEIVLPAISNLRINICDEILNLDRKNV